MCAVLIADPGAADRDRLRQLLSEADLPVHEVVRASDILPGLDEAEPDALLLGVDFFQDGGAALCRTIQAHARWAGLPVLLLTHRDDEPLILTALEAGAADYVRKDAPDAVILARVCRLVRYRQLSRLAALNDGLVQAGRLLAGIVHEIRSPIAVIRGHAEILRLEFPDLPGLDERLEPILQSCRLLQVRLEHLMASVRGGPSSPQPLSIPEFLEEVGNLFHKSSDPRSPRIVVRTHCPAGLPPVHGDFGRLMQVFLNLLGNARESIVSARGSGQIRLTAAVETAEGDDGVRIAVDDDGPGIPEAQLDRIFEPFFTTKPDGSGFGLYLARQIIHEHHGWITARNLPTGGACLSVWLPLSAPVVCAESAG